MLKATLILALVLASTLAMTHDLQAASKPQALVLTDSEAGYDQAAYDACMDDADSTPAQCDAI